MATRLNGYCGIYGKLSYLDKEIDSFGLDKQLQFDLRRVVCRAILPQEPSASIVRTLYTMKPVRPISHYWISLVKLSDLDKEINSFGLDKQLQFELRKVVRRAILPLEPSAC